MVIMFSRQNDVDSGSSLHTQLWIDPVEEFLQYVHTGNPVDVTVGVKELKVHQCAISSELLLCFTFPKYNVT